MTYRRQRCKKCVAPLYHYEPETHQYIRRCLTCECIAEQITAEMVDRMPWELMSPLLRQAVTRRRETLT